MLAEKVFGSKSKIKLIRVFYNFPVREFSLSDLTRIMKRSTGTIHPSLASLVDSGVILSRKVGGSALYRLNIKNPFVKKLTEIFKTEEQFLTKTAVSFVKELNKKHIVSIILFGSVATGEISETSDIDLLIVFDKNRKIVERNVDNIMDKYLKMDIHISPVFYSKMEIIGMIKGYNTFIIRVQEDGKPLFGKSLNNIR